MTETGIVPADWQAWQHSWDRQQEWYLPDREERFRVMLDLVEAVAGPAPVVLDLACGTGSISDRLLKRLPDARSTALDLDPALLTIAQGYFADEPRIQFVTADLRDPDWPRKLPHREYDAVLSSTALHWLRTESLARVYGQIAGALKDGGVFMNADHMPDPGTPRINEAERALRHARMERERAGSGVPDWREWWRLAAADEQLADAVARRYEIFGDHADGEPHPVEWHARTLREAGFSEARAVWRSVPDAVVLGLK
ncbi:class I SAM-dependent methyltransferase [Streptantibioticus rubrisoli]|uniref:Class I SAM-dependent methyltransferase n=1 Tax=Streptantibioticus rubrisoli TaxID=1387313 RepID=A0ABT1PDF3_9ACTN|nr:class I SAM-dependent methyltransferase [Streptantibioticus rubrisoli]MCQ4042841.1 class I SAM-dependent methyltransferase [Streptantibioticus rubrisoli]